MRNDKKPLRLGFIDTYDAAIQFFTSLLSDRFDIILGSNPEFVIFGDENFGTQNRKYDNTGVVKIFYTGENRRPENYYCNYAISFDYHAWKHQWHYRMPLYIMEQWAIEHFHNIEEFGEKSLYSDCFTIVEDREYFCGFVHRNPANPIRNEFCQFLSNNYKIVTCAGPVLKNVDFELPTVLDKLKFFKKCKFALCFENSAHPGYVTEKILHAFYAGAIPIYWGGLGIEHDFNPKSFINATDRDYKDVLNEIKMIDNDQYMFNYMRTTTKLPINIEWNPFAFLNWFEAVVYEKKFMRKY